MALLLSRCFRPSSIRKATAATGSLENYNKHRLTKAAVASILTSTPCETGCDDARNPETHPFLVVVRGIRRFSLNTDDKIDDSSLRSDTNDKRDDESVEASRRRAHSESMWYKRYEELKSYVAEHGHSLVPRRYEKNESLGFWVCHQRQNFKVKQLGGSSGDIILSRERIQKLDEIGFVWDVLEAQWFQRLQELKAYKQNHGDTLVPSDYSENPSLGDWVSNQRKDYAYYQKIKEINEKYRGVEVLDEKAKEELERLTKRSGGMTEKRIELLEAEGFVWDVLEAQWMKRLQELKVYKQNHGDALVPNVYLANPSLGKWVQHQREYYKHYQKLKEIKQKWRGVEVLDDEVKNETERLTRRSAGMTEKRIQLLEAEDFVWDAYDFAWESRFQELCNFVALNGHAAIRQRRRGTNDPLAAWVSLQRQYYRKHQNGQHTTLNDERIKKLNSIGILWDLPNTSAQRQPRMRRQSRSEGACTP
ncbi:hypothetical protein ACHAXA_010886 [Cyclostephanos tholiformis]|uniref:Helicase-associated domain-containing protein n=1 Tax=Cyclostephanos tholiformis TaxID=382380 RepID=A0ABD3R6H0_9STRA